MDVVKQVRVTVPDLSSKVKDARLLDGRSAQALATAAGISTAYWYQIENNQRQWLSEEILRGIENALGIDFGVNFDEL
jgi:transcriptional regulator with XRE-family HTH domain